MFGSGRKDCARDLEGVARVGLMEEAHQPGTWVRQTRAPGGRGGMEGCEGGEGAWVGVECQI